MKNRDKGSYFASLALSVLLAFAIGAVILAVAGFNPVQAYAAMVDGA